MGRPRKYAQAPLYNCLECERYDECEKYTSGRCPKRDRKMGVHKGTQLRPKYSFAGYSMSVHEWADFLSVKYSTLYGRLYRHGVDAFEIYYKEEFENAKGKR